MNPNKEPLRRLYGYLGRYWPRYALGTVLQISNEGTMQLIMAWMLAGLTNAAVYQRLPSLINVLGLSLLGIVLISLTLPIAARWRGKAVEAATHDLRQSLFEHIQELPMSYLEQVHSGDIVSRLTNDITAAKEAMGDALVQFLSALVSGLLCAVAMSRISWKFTALAFLLGALPLLYNRATAPRLQKVNTRSQESLADLNSRLKDLLAGFSVIKAFVLESHLVGSYDQANRAAKENGLLRVRHQSTTVAANDLLSTMNFLSLLALGSYLMAKGEVSPGSAIAAVQLLNGLVQPFSNLGDLWVRLQTARAGVVRVFELLDQPNEQWQRTEGSTMGTDEVVTFRNVQFAFDTKPVLQGLSLSVTQGQVVALVGPSGGGKSTVLKLLLGFHQVKSGSIIVAGRQLTDYTVEELRQKMAFVPQEAYLYAGTIQENISCGKLRATEEEIVAAARAANAHEFITQLPDGYQTQVGERGAQLSGGQRQRIAIARAILKDAPILLLDEATSSLDSESERLVQDALERLMVGRTTLVIAHRLSTIRRADCIHVVVDGQIVESGSHEQLMEIGGVYRRLNEIQVGSVA